MFILLLGALFAAAYVHWRLRGPRTGARLRELVLVYLLAGYCGLPMIGVGVLTLTGSERMAEMIDAAPGNRFQEFFGWSYLGLAVIASLTIWLRGLYLAGPAISWAIYWIGGTWIHIVQYGGLGGIGAGLLVRILLTHALVPLVLLAVTAIAFRRGDWRPGG